MIEYDAHEPGTWRDAALHFRAENERLTAELAAVTAERDALRDAGSVLAEYVEHQPFSLARMTAIEAWRAATTDAVNELAGFRDFDAEWLANKTHRQRASPGGVRETFYAAGRLSGLAETSNAPADLAYLLSELDAATARAERRGLRLRRQPNGAAAVRRAHIDADGRLDLGDQARRAGYQPGTVVDVLLTLAGQLIITVTDEPVLIDVPSRPVLPERRSGRLTMGGVHR